MSSDASVFAQAMACAGTVQRSESVYRDSGRFWTEERDAILCKIVSAALRKIGRKTHRRSPGEPRVPIKWAKIAEEMTATLVCSRPRAQAPSNEVIVRRGAAAPLSAEGPLRRSGKQCCERYTNCLAPGLKHGNWTAEEDREICRLQASAPNRWKEMAYSPVLSCRSSNAIKNRWNSTLAPKPWKIDGRRHSAVADGDVAAADGDVAAADGDVAAASPPRKRRKSGDSEFLISPPLPARDACPCRPPSLSPERDVPLGREVIAIYDLPFSSIFDRRLSPIAGTYLDSILFDE